MREAGNYPTAREIYEKYLPGSSLGFRSELCASAVEAVCGVALTACDKDCMWRCTKNTGNMWQLSFACMRKGASEPVVLCGAAKSMPTSEIWQQGGDVAFDFRLDPNEAVEIEEGKKETRKGADGNVPLSDFR